jgi:flagellar motor switch/type III secretory pathway protein FliN
MPDVIEHSGQTSQAIQPIGLVDGAMALSKILSQCIAEFWGKSLQVKLFSIADTPHYFWHVQDFYVAQKGLDKEGKRWAQLRISEGVCQNLFESTLGKSLDDPGFTMSHLRSFEVYLLEQFSRKLFRDISPVILQKPKPDQPYYENEPLMHLHWTVESESDQVNQLVLTAPVSCLQIPKTPSQSPKVWHLPETVFMHAHAQVVLRVGQTRARLEDLQQLEAGDVVVFEESDSQAWLLWVPGATRWFRAPVHYPDRYRQSTLLAEGSKPMQETQTKTTIWDALEVEVSASFQPIKLPLKQLKELEQGLVLEVGNLMDNRIIVEVEGHPVAWGELLVLGDKFGVRIQALHEKVEGMAQNLPAVTEVVTPQLAVTPHTQQPQPVVQPEMTSDQPAADTLRDLQLDESDFDDLDDEEDWT